jgi:hypothetical protein
MADYVIPPDSQITSIADLEGNRLNGTVFSDPKLSAEQHSYNSWHRKIYPNQGWTNRDAPLPAASKSRGPVEKSPSEIKIDGNPTPTVGSPAMYSLKVPAVQQSGVKTISNQAVAIWEIDVLENGRWRKTTGKAQQGDSATYTFNEKSLYREGIMLRVTKGQIRQRLLITPQRAVDPKLNSLELCHVDNTSGSTFNHLEIVRAKASGVKLQGKEIVFHLWPGDATSTDASKNVPLATQYARGDKNSVAYAEFSLTRLLKSANDFKQDILFQVVAEYYDKQQKDTDSSSKTGSDPGYNTGIAYDPVKNPNVKPEPPAGYNPHPSVDPLAPSSSQNVRGIASKDQEITYTRTGKSITCV